MKINFILIFLIFTGGLAAAQSFYNNGSVVTIGANTTFAVKDSLVNKGTLTNNGNMVMGGVWLNLGTYNPGLGEITFNSPTGSGPQVINHNNQSVSKLTISGGGEKLILADLTIVDELVLTDGIITGENNSKVVFQQGATVSGGSTQSHIKGPVYHIGTGNKLFPVGNGTVYLPVEVSGIGSTSEVGITLVDFSSPQSFNFNEELSAASTMRYWEVDVVSGSLTGSQITLPINGDEDFSTTDVTRFVATQSLDSPIEFESLGQSAVTGSSTSGRITSNEAVTANLVSIGVTSEQITVFNAISADGDPRNAIMRISNIMLYPKNKVSIFNRWGDKVFEVTGYDNDQKVFLGKSNMGGNSDLPAGTYFYVIDLGNGSELKNGYISLKR